MQEPIIIYGIELSDIINIILMFIYVVATVFICIFNGKSAKATRLQTKESQKQFLDNNRGQVIISFRSIGVFAFIVSNIGNSYATNVKVKINEDFILNCKDDLKNSLQKLGNSNFVIGPKQEYTLIAIPFGNDNFFDNVCKFNIEYETLNEKYFEEITIDLSQYSWASNLKYPEEKFIDETLKNEKQLLNELKIFNKSMDKLNFEINHFKCPLSNDAKILMKNFSYGIDLNEIKKNPTKSYYYHFDKSDLNKNIYNYDNNAKILLEELKNFKYITNSSTYFLDGGMNIYFTKEGISFIEKLQ